MDNVYLVVFSYVNDYEYMEDYQGTEYEVWKVFKNKEKAEQFVTDCKPEDIVLDFDHQEIISDVIEKDGNDIHREITTKSRFDKYFYYLDIYEHELIE